MLPIAHKARDTDESLDLSPRKVLAIVATIAIYCGLAGLTTLALSQPSRSDAILSGLAVQSAIKGLLATFEEYAS